MNFEQITGTVCSDSGDDNLPIFEELLYTKLHKEGYAMEDASIEHTFGEVEVVEESRSIERSRLALVTLPVLIKVSAPGPSILQQNILRSLNLTLDS